MNLALNLAPYQLEARRKGKKCDDPTCQCHDGKLSLDKLNEVRPKGFAAFNSSTKGINRLKWAFRNTRFSLSCELDKYKFKENMEIPLTPFDRKAKRIQPITTMIQNIKSIPVLDFYEKNAIKLCQSVRKTNEAQP